MAVTTRNKTSPAKPASKKKAPASKQSKKAAKPVVESDSEEQEEQFEIDQQIIQEEDDEEEEDDEPTKAEDSDDEPAFKIHAPKASTEPRITPAALPTVTYEDDSEEDDSDEAPEAESLSTAKAKVQSAQDKEKSFLSKIQAEQKAKRVEREQKLKEQKEQSKAKKKAAEPAAPTSVSESTAGKPSALPTMLPMDILESVAEMDNQKSKNKEATTNDKKRKHMRPEDFALMELEAELKAAALKRKKTEKKQKNVGPVTVKVLDKSQFAQAHAIPQTVIDFREKHFSKVPRLDPVLNKRRLGRAAAVFHRK
ncbi:hypothetical protein FBU30_006413 [Linnemannia zychae]|nr:hypothetical protein FBU30_006413 [Linnemannia zychae]